MPSIPYMLMQVNVALMTSALRFGPIPNLGMISSPVSLLILFILNSRNKRVYTKVAHIVKFLPNAIW